MNDEYYDCEDEQIDVDDMELGLLALTFIFRSIAYDEKATWSRLHPQKDYTVPCAGPNLDITYSDFQTIQETISFYRRHKIIDRNLFHQVFKASQSSTFTHLRLPEYQINRQIANHNPVKIWEALERLALCYD
jgi:hypothetical protein